MSTVEIQKETSYKTQQDSFETALEIRLKSHDWFGMDIVS
jgi:hypothetical protein